jgi:hypothetical protein
MCIGRAEREGGEQILILGLSQENIDRLSKGQPMHVSREKHGDGVPDGWEILILYGKTEADIHRQLAEAGAIGEETQIFKDPRL